MVLSYYNLFSNKIKRLFYTMSKPIFWPNLFSYIYSSYSDMKAIKKAMQETRVARLKFERKRVKSKSIIQPSSRPTINSNQLLRYHRVSWDHSWWSKVPETYIPCITSFMFFCEIHILIFMMLWLKLTILMCSWDELMQVSHILCSAYSQTTNERWA